MEDITQYPCKKKIGRNDPCWCGSNIKFKRCHGKVVKDTSSVHNKYEKRLDTEFIQGMMSACELARDTLNFLEKMLSPGITTNMIDSAAYNFITRNGAKPSPLNYKGYPKSICVSLNNVICHGIPDDTVIKSGDIVNIDVTCNLNGYHGDTSKTFPVGECSSAALQLIAVTKECLHQGIQATKPYGRLGSIGSAIQQYAHLHSFSVVEKFVGHGIGKNFHEEPQVCHFGRENKGELILPGMFFTIEPMINEGTKSVNILDDGWTAVTADGKLSAQFEHTIMVDRDTIKILTL